MTLPYYRASNEKEENSKIINVEDSFFQLNIREKNYDKKGKIDIYLNLQIER